MEINSIISKFKNQYVPTIDKKLRYTFTGEIAAPVKNTDSYTYYDGETLVSIDKSFIIDFPVYRISKSIENIVEGDIIRTGNDVKWTYSKVTKITKNKITTLTYRGNVKKVIPIKEFFTSISTVDVVINVMKSMTGNPITPSTRMFDSANQTNPMMMALMMSALSKDSSNSSFSKLLPLMMMQGGNMMNPMGGMNPMMMMALSQKSDFENNDNDDLLMLMLMSNMSNGFNPFATSVTKPVTANETSVDETDEVTSDEVTVDGTIGDLVERLSEADTEETEAESNSDSSND